MSKVKNKGGVWTKLRCINLSVIGQGQSVKVKTVMNKWDII